MPRERTDTCAKGHPWTVENTYLIGRKRACRACHRERQRRRWDKDSARRADARMARINAWKRDIAAADLAWAAGHFEGEGTISISAERRHGYARPLASLASTDREVIDLFSVWWPTSCADKAPRYPTPNSRAVYRWEINSAAKVRAFIDQIRPHLRTERCRTKFDLVSEFTDKVLAAHIGKTKPRHPEYIEAIRRLNQRGQIMLANGETVLERIERDNVLALASSAAA